MIKLVLKKGLFLIIPLIILSCDRNMIFNPFLKNQDSSLELSIELSYLRVLNFENNDSELRVFVTVSAPDINIITKELTINWETGKATGTVLVKKGQNRLFRVEGKLSSGQLFFSGEKVINIDKNRLILTIPVSLNPEFFQELKLDDGSFEVFFYGEEQNQTMFNRFNTSGKVKLLSIKFFVKGTESFSATIWDANGNFILSKDATGVIPPGWVEINVQDLELEMESGFYVGFTYSGNIDPIDQVWYPLIGFDTGSYAGASYVLYPQSNIFARVDQFGVTGNFGIRARVFYPALGKIVEITPG